MMVSYCRNLIDVGLLSEKERKWTDEHHGRMREELGGISRGKRHQLTLSWLERETQPP